MFWDNLVFVAAPPVGEEAPAKLFSRRYVGPDETAPAYVGPPGPDAQLCAAADAAHKRAFWANDTFYLRYGGRWYKVTDPGADPGV